MATNRLLLLVSGLRLNAYSMKHAIFSTFAEINAKAVGWLRQTRSSVCKRDAFYEQLMCLMALALVKSCSFLFFAFFAFSLSSFPSHKELCASVRLNSCLLFLLKSVSHDPTRYLLWLALSNKVRHHQPCSFHTPSQNSRCAKGKLRGGGVGIFSF